MHYTGQRYINPGEFPVLICRLFPRADQNSAQRQKLSIALLKYLQLNFCFTMHPYFKIRSRIFNAVGSVTINEK